MAFKLFLSRKSLEVLMLLVCVSISNFSFACAPIEGSEKLLRNQSTHYLIVSDYHGTNEIPAFFSDLVCHALEANRKIAVALEWPEDMTVVASRFLDEPDNLKARKDFLAAWGPPQTDGRASTAMLKMFEQLKTFRENGKVIPLILFQPVIELAQNDYEASMAKAILTQREKDQSDLVLVLVGGAHAMKKAHSTMPDVRSMARNFPQDQTVTLGVDQYLGHAWGCRKPEADGKLICQDWPLEDGTPKPRGIRLNDRPDDFFDGRYSVGQAFTASHPWDEKFDRAQK